MLRRTFLQWLGLAPVAGCANPWVKPEAKKVQTVKVYRAGEPIYVGDLVVINGKPHVIKRVISK